MSRSLDARCLAAASRFFRPARRWFFFVLAVACSELLEIGGACGGVLRFSDLLSEEGEAAVGRRVERCWRAAWDSWALGGNFRRSCTMKLTLVLFEFLSIFEGSVLTSYSSRCLALAPEYPVNNDLPVRNSVSHSSRTTRASFRGVQLGMAKMAEIVKGDLNEESFHYAGI